LRSNAVIQGYFPTGLSRIATPQAQAQAADRTPAWVRQRVMQLHSAAPAQPSRIATPPCATPNATAIRLPDHLAAFHHRSGQPLPAGVRQKMEALFGQSFADVRVHVGPHVSAMGAVAFTQGTDIHMAPGRYEPSTPRGQAILGHELTHVVQQRAGRVRNPFGGGVAVVQDRALEAEADRMARRAAEPSRSARATIQRARVGVGFDAYHHAGNGGVLVTSGLDNCIAIVAHDAATGTAVMAHFNTGSAGSIAVGWRMPLSRLRRVLEARLQQAAGRVVAPTFHVGIGQVWWFVSQGGDPDQRDTLSRLMTDCHAVFGTQPTQFGETVEFNLANGVLTGSITGTTGTLPDNWRDHGTAIDYRTLDQVTTTTTTTTTTDDDSCVVM